MPKLFTFKVPKGKKINVKPNTDFEFKEPEEVVGLIHGREPGSVNEWHVAKGLERAKLEYNYQVSLGGGNLFRGGRILDFLVFTPGAPTPLLVHGDYWHGGSKSDVSLEMEDIKRLLGHGYQDPQVIWGHECMDIQQAYNWIKRKLK